MKVDKTFKMDNKTAEEFDNEVVEYLVTNYDCDKERATFALHNCLAFEWALCESPKGIVGIQTNYDRSEIKVGQ